MKSEKKVSPKFLLGSILFATNTYAIAQEGIVDNEAVLGTVNVIADSIPEEIESKNSLKVDTTRIGKGVQAIRDIPQNVTVMTEKLLNDRELDDFRDVLKFTSGVTFQAGETGEEDVLMRGFSLGQAGDILRDGMREASLITRDTFATDRVEVIKGSASMLFGKGSTGGVVNQVSKRAFFADYYQLEAKIGDGRFGRLQADLNKDFGKNGAVRLNLMTQSADQWGSKDNRNGVALNWRNLLGNGHELMVDLYHLKTDQRPIYNHPWLLTGNNGELNRKIVPVLDSKNFYGFRSDYNQTEQTVVTVGHTVKFSVDEELKTTLRYGKYERDLWASVVSFAVASLQPDGKAVSLDNMPTDATVLTRNSFKGRRGISDIFQLQSDYSNKFELGGFKHHLMAGVDITHENAKRNNNNSGGSLALSDPLATTTVGNPNDGAYHADTRTWIYNEFESQSIGVYLQDIVSLSKQWKVVAGVRFDRFNADYYDYVSTNSGSRADNLFSPRFGLIFEPNTSSSYYVSYGESYNTSGDTYQFSLGNFAPGSNNEKAANTPPEKSRNLEVGGKWELFNQRALVGLALFRSEKYNERNTDPDAAATQMLLSGKRHATGVELSFAGQITPRWEFFYNHTWIPDAEIDECNESTCTGNAQREGDRPGLTPRNSASAWTTYRIDNKWRVGLGMTHRSEQSPVGNRSVVASSFTTWDAMVEYQLHPNTALKLTVTNLTDELYADALYRGFYSPGEPRRVYLSINSVF